MLRCWCFTCPVTLDSWITPLQLFSAISFSTLNILALGLSGACTKHRKKIRSLHSSKPTASPPTWQSERPEGGQCPSGLGSDAQFQNVRWWATYCTFVFEVVCFTKMPRITDSMKFLLSLDFPYNFSNCSNVTSQVVLVRRPFEICNGCDTQWFQSRGSSVFVFPLLLSIFLVLLFDLQVIKIISRLGLAIQVFSIQNLRESNTNKTPIEVGWLQIYFSNLRMKWRQARHLSLSDASLNLLERASLHSFTIARLLGCAQDNGHVFELWDSSSKKNQLMGFIKVSLLRTDVSFLRRACPMASTSQEWHFLFLHPPHVVEIVCFQRYWKVLCWPAWQTGFVHPMHSLLKKQFSQSSLTERQASSRCLHVKGFNCANSFQGFQRILPGMLFLFARRNNMKNKTLHPYQACFVNDVGLLDVVVLL